MPREELRIAVRCNRHAPQVVRHALEGLPEFECVPDDALLVASELVTNAVRHSRCTEEESLTVCVRCQDDRMGIAVTDPGASGRRAVVTDRPIECGGVGLKVVQELSNRWGSERQSDGYEVWAELSLAA